MHEKSRSVTPFYLISHLLHLTLLCASFPIIQVLYTILLHTSNICFNYSYKLKQESDVSSKIIYRNGSHDDGCGHVAGHIGGRLRF